MTPTTQQQAFLEALLTSTGHIALVARAGCGKTSTILMGVKEYAAKYPKAEILVCAFNKAIAAEVAEKLRRMGLMGQKDENGKEDKRVRAATLHSLGFSLVQFFFRLPKEGAVDEKKVKKLVDASNNPICRRYSGQIVALVHVAKQAGVGFFPDLPIGNVQVWHDLADHFDLNGLDDTSEADAVVEAAQTIYRQSLDQTNVIDYDDMILFPLIKNLRVKFTKDVVIIDEYQDTGRARQALARKFVKAHTGKFVMVGDDRQAIYGFSGADASALANGIKEMDAQVLPLSVTWRCPKKVVALAQTLVPDIEAALEAPEGEVIRAAEMPKDLVAGQDAILCRNTAPLIQIAYSLIRLGIPAKVEGRSIGEGLVNLVTRWKIKTIDALLNRLEEYEAREKQKALAKGNEAKVEEIADKVATIREICSACTQKGLKDVADVEAFIGRLFADGDTKSVILATYHRSKGREWDRVILFEHGARCPSKAARQDWQKEQEVNLAYVAYTRAKDKLVFVN